MLKSTLLFLFGCSFCFAQIQVSTTSTMNLEGDGTKVKSTDGQGSGSGPSTPPPPTYNNTQVMRDNTDVFIDQGKLNVIINQQDKKISRYFVNDGYGNKKIDEIISATNSFKVDISNLNSGHYYISVVLVSPNVVLTKSFIKP
ncbi:hypothetical protein OF897_02315 [Chryseobacterium formosus]|uniref:Secretion system C-terminal sorting domain-containing protein n=1 Tax=Chryseobacterium formosus TaxID=1537363 RepID=A0ABT3XKU8_9FLAO|nr:hypothetical protein [Chryseobacterium formosus]MCX8522754.1 hypothetical protein [Chryseobacterium formosus]